MQSSSVQFGEINQMLVETLASTQSRCVVIYDKAVSEYHKRIVAILESQSKQHLSFALASGEEAKELGSISEVWDFLGQENIARNDILIALGGGSTTDLVGFAAATWMRGIRFINIPTTLLGMVDASVGGKTAINSKFGKNLIGSFHSPYAVLIDTIFLQSLEPAEISNGLAEVVKCGFIHDPYILKLLEDVDKNYAELIQRSVRVKQHYVSEDPLEQKPGVREILNYGHTLGHALEKVLQYNMSHGQAIAVGMHFAIQLSLRLGFVNDDLVTRHVAAIENIGLQTTVANVAWADVIGFIRRDKKNLSGNHRFILLKDLAHAEVVEGIDESILEETFEKVRS